MGTGLISIIRQHTAQIIWLTGLRPELCAGGVVGMGGGWGAIDRAGRELVDLDFYTPGGGGAVVGAGGVDHTGNNPQLCWS